VLVPSGWQQHGISILESINGRRPWLGIKTLSLPSEMKVLSFIVAYAAAYPVASQQIWDVVSTLVLKYPTFHFFLTFFFLVADKVGQIKTIFECQPFQCN
jgi:hypothetical protein